MKSPTEKQIKFAEQISQALGLNFPTCSEDFSSSSYFNFISTHIDEYNALGDWGDEDVYFCLNDVWTEHY